MIKYTVIIPAYNAEKTLTRCLDSLLAQGRSDIRILLIDDGSTDGTDRIARAFCEKSPMLEYHRQANGGVSSARNLGLSLARSEYVSFVDSDDYVMPGYFDTLDQIGGSDLLVFDRSHVGGKLRDDTGIFQQLSELTDTVEILELLMDSKKIMQPVNKCFRLELILKHDLRFNETLHIAEDFAFCMAYAVHCGSISVSREKSYCVDVSDGDSLSRRYRQDLAQQLSTAAELVASSIREANFPPEPESRLLARLDELDSRNLLMSIAEEFKSDRLRLLGSRARTARICAVFDRSFSQVHLGSRHRLLRLLLKMRLYTTLYILAYIVRGRIYRAARKEAHHA